jgi:hypothetical protein
MRPQVVATTALSIDQSVHLTEANVPLSPDTFFGLQPPLLSPPIRLLHRRRGESDHALVPFASRRPLSSSAITFSCRLSSVLSSFKVSALILAGDPTLTPPLAYPGQEPRRTQGRARDVPLPAAARGPSRGVCLARSPVPHERRHHVALERASLRRRPPLRRPSCCCSDARRAPARRAVGCSRRVG